MNLDGLNKVLSLVANYDSAYYQYQKGALDKEVFERGRDGVIFQVNNPSFREYWGLSRQLFANSFEALVDQ